MPNTNNNTAAKGSILVNERFKRNRPSVAELNAKARNRYQFSYPNIHKEAFGGKVAAYLGPGLTTVKADFLSTYYSIPVFIGTPGKRVEVDLDTGSSDFWVKAEPDGSDTNFFDPKKSKTFKLLKGSTFDVTYDIGSARGDVGLDTVTIGKITVRNQAIGLVKGPDAEKDDVPALIGMGWTNGNTTMPHKQNVLMDNMIQQSLLEMGLFTLSCHVHGGFYTFGFIDCASAGVKEDDIHYTKVTKREGYWEFKSTFALVNGERYDLGAKHTAIADTGTTLCYVQESLAKLIYKNIDKARYSVEDDGWIFPEGSQLPVVKLAVGDYVFTIRPEAFAYESARSSDGMVVGAIQSKKDDDVDIFGDAFLQNVYTIFDHANVRIGMAQKPAEVSAKENAPNSAEMKINDSLGVTPIPSEAEALNQLEIINQGGIHPDFDPGAFESAGGAKGEYFPDPNKPAYKPPSHTSGAIPANFDPLQFETPGASGEYL